MAKDRLSPAARRRIWPGRTRKSRAGIRTATFKVKGLFLTNAPPAKSASPATINPADTQSRWLFARMNCPVATLPAPNSTRNGLTRASRTFFLNLARKRATCVPAFLSRFIMRNSLPTTLTFLPFPPQVSDWKNLRPNKLLFSPNSAQHLRLHRPPRLLLSGLLVGAADAQQAGFAEIRAEQLDADRQPGRPARRAARCPGRRRGWPARSAGRRTASAPNRRTPRPSGRPWWGWWGSAARPGGICPAGRRPASKSRRISVRTRSARW